MPSGARTNLKGGITSRSIRERGIFPDRLHQDIPLGAYAFERFAQHPVAVGANGYSDPIGTTGATNYLRTPQLSLVYHVKGAGQTLLAPALDMTNGGLLAGLDAGASEGVEYVAGGMVTAHNVLAHKVGTDPSSFFRAKLKVQTVANAAECALGWRKAEAFQANFDAYDELAALNMQAGDIKIETILNGAAAATKDTTKNWADGETHTLEVWVGYDGKVRFFVDDVEAAVARHTFDSAEVLVPFIFWLQGAGGTSTLHVTELEAGRLWHVGVDASRR